MIVRLAVRMSVALEEVASSQLLRAVVAREMLRMPGLAQRRNDLADDWLVAGIAASLLGSGHSLAAHVGLKVSCEEERHNQKCGVCVLEVAMKMSPVAAANLA